MQEKGESSQANETVLASEDFEALVEVFRTLLVWSNDQDRGIEDASIHGRNNH